MTVIDCHAHFEPAMLDTPALFSKMDAAGVDQVALIPAMIPPLPELPERLLAGLRMLVRSPLRPLAELVHRSTMTRDGGVKILGNRYAIFAQPDNASVASLVERHPDRLKGWIFLNPKVDANPLDELERWRAVPGMIGVKLHPHWHDYRTDILGPVLTRAEELGLPVLIHLGFRKRGDFRSMAEQHPKLTLISAHAGFPFFKDLWRYKKAYPNLYVDLSSPYLDERLARETVQAMGAERCLYGTDAPYGFPDGEQSYDYDAIKGWIARLPVPEREQERILGGTFAELLGGS